jgi:hypothetical protein
VIDRAPARSLCLILPELERWGGSDGKDEGRNDDGGTGSTSSMFMDSDPEKPLVLTNTAAKYYSLTPE